MEALLKRIREPFIPPVIQTFVPRQTWFPSLINCWLDTFRM